MPITTVYTCDKCGTAVEPTSLFHLSVVVRACVKTTYGTQAKPIAEEMHACTACMTELGVGIPERDKDKVAVTTTLEDLITEIAVEAAQDAIENA